MKLIVLTQFGNENSTLVFTEERKMYNELKKSWKFDAKNDEGFKVLRLSTRRRMSRRQEKRRWAMGNEE